MELNIPKLSLVVLIGTSGSGKSTFAKKHFLPTEIISSDYCRALLSDDENNQSVTPDAFELLHYLAGRRLKLGKLTVVDATNVHPEDRKALVAIARQYHALPVAVVFFLPEKICHERNRARADRDFGPHVIRNQRSALGRSLKKLKYEGFRHIFTFNDQETVDGATVTRVPLWNDKRDLTGPFDIIGDVHGCYDELVTLLERLGYVTDGAITAGPLAGPAYVHPQGRTAVFLGDIVDRGPRIVDTLRLVYNMVQRQAALCVPGNHDMKLMRKLKGRDVTLTHGLDKTLHEIDTLPDEIRPAFISETAAFLDGLVSHYLLDNGRLVVSHAGIKEEMQGRGSGAVREFCLYGETTGETDEYGLPVRYNWALDYRGRAVVAYGHTPIVETEWLNNTINLDTGCAFGGKLSALRYPEKEIVQVPARRVYHAPAKPFPANEDAAPALTLQQQHDDVLILDDLYGKKIINTRYSTSVTIREENAAAALEVMSRHAVNPKWIIYLPPTMSPSETSTRPEYLEYPEEAFAYFKNQGVPRVICEQKHMGSRAVVVICRDIETVRRRFGLEDAGMGICYTRTGRRFFKDREMEAAFLERIQTALTRADFWNRFDSDWFCLDCELMPWSEKAQELLKGQYAAVGAAGGQSLDAACGLLELLADRKDLEKNYELPKESGAFPVSGEKLLAEYRHKKQQVAAFQTAYRHYCWPVNSLADLKLAPFHLLASEKSVHVNKDHLWHMNTLKELAGNDEGLILATPYRVVDVTDTESVKQGCAWWEELVHRGDEGMVVKPLEFIARGKRGVLQPAVKCRGPEYLRIIYGPEYDTPSNLSRLKARGLGAKRSLALREFVLGIEALEHFVHHEPLRRIHECVFGVLAMESQPVDPRL